MVTAVFCTAWLSLDRKDCTLTEKKGAAEPFCLQFFITAATDWNEQSTTFMNLLLRIQLLFELEISCLSNCISPDVQ